MPSTGVAMLDFDELQEFSKISSWATKSDFICGQLQCKQLQWYEEKEVKTIINRIYIHLINITRLLL